MFIGPPLVRTYTMLKSDRVKIVENKITTASTGISNGKVMCQKHAIGPARRSRSRLRSIRSHGRQDSQRRLRGTRLPDHYRPADQVYRGPRLKGICPVPFSDSKGSTTKVRRRERFERWGRSKGTSVSNRYWYLGRFNPD